MVERAGLFDLAFGIFGENGLVEGDYTYHSPFFNFNT